MSRWSFARPPQVDLCVPASQRWPQSLQTPCYVFDPDTVLARYSALRDSLGTRLLVSLKANPNPDLFVRCGHAFDDGLELASAGELELAVGRGRHEIWLNNPSFSDDFIRAGIASRCKFVIDSVDMADRLIALNPANSAVDTLVRINAEALLPGRAPSAWIDHFGMTLQEAAYAASHLEAAGLRVAGLHVFVGSHGFRPPPGGPTSDASGSPADSADLADALAEFADQLSAAAREPLDCLHLGGGFSATPLEAAPWRRYRQRLAPLSKRYRLTHEAGRAVFADAGAFVTRITALKYRDDRIVAVCDGGLSHNFLLAQTESVLKARPRPHLVDMSDACPAAPPDPRPVILVGNTCHRSDVIGHLPAGSVPPRRDQLAVFERCGAYHATYTVSGFLSQRPPRVYIRQG
ncbi:MAG: PLP-dependent decarboxylase [Pseudomonadota bacterium]|nr:PLP-dependent decarboxylase [Pseudomonadota bacterium]